MTIAELMKDKTPKSDYEGWVTNDDMVLAVDCGSVPATEITPASVAEFTVVEMGVTALDSQLNPITQDKTYLRAGQSTMKTGNQRSFSVTSDRYAGDAFQDFALSHAIMYGKGSEVVRKYVYFNILTGKGESGELSIIVNSDGSGNAGESAEVDIELKKNKSAPVEYTYAAAI